MKRRIEVTETTREEEDAVVVAMVEEGETEVTIEATAEAGVVEIEEDTEASVAEEVVVTGDSMMTETEGTIVLVEGK